MEARKTQCINGHFFDGNKYNVCPLCGAVEKEAGTATVVDLRSQREEDLKKDKKEKIEKGGFFKFVRSNKTVDELNKSDNPTRGLGGGLQPEVPETVPEPEVEKEIKGSEIVNNPKEVETIEQKETREDVILESIPQKAPSLINQVNEKATTIDAKTTGRYTTESAEPVVGWLVCIQGESQGLSFEIYEGKNSIGRMRTNKVCLADENSVSREKHAIIIFDAKNTTFYIQSGESDKMTYLNNSPVLMPQQLHEFDKIQLGECELLFIPLCSERFKWEDYIK